MNRKIIKTYTDIDLSYEAHAEDNELCEIDELINALNDAKAKGATHLDFGGYCSWDSVDEVYIRPVILSEESKDAYESRLQEERLREEARKKNFEEQERQEYFRLKEKFGF